jgi:signal transduction histidine kinase
MAAGERVGDRPPATNARSQPGSPTFSDLERRRAQLWTVSIVLVATVVTVIALLIAGRGFLFEALTLDSLTVWIIGVLLVGLLLAFILYVLEKERNIRRMSQVLIDEKIAHDAMEREMERDKERIARLEELDRLKSDFVATVSHELRTPLTAIIGAAKTIARKGDRMDAAQHSSLVDMIGRQGERLFRLVDDVLTASRIESGLAPPRREQVDLEAAARTVVADLKHAYPDEKRGIDIEATPPGARAWGDADSIQQILANLIENAIKYSGPGARVIVRVSSTPNEAVLEVSDEGAGIAPDHLKSIFDRFRQVEASETRSAGGFGLGLFIVKNLVESHRGTVDVSSEVGKGTTFRIHLPQRA